MTVLQDQQLSREDQLEKKREGLLEQSYAEACPECGAVVFEWWDGCRDCGLGDEVDPTEQTTLTEVTRSD